MIDIEACMAAKRAAAKADADYEAAIDAHEEAERAVTEAQDEATIAERDWHRLLEAQRADTVAELLHLRALDCLRLGMVGDRACVSDGHGLLAVLNGALPPIAAPPIPASAALLLDTVETWPLVGYASIEALADAAEEVPLDDPRNDERIVALPIDGVLINHKLVRKWALAAAEAASDATVSVHAGETKGATEARAVAFRGLGWVVVLMPLAPYFDGPRRDFAMREARR